MKIIRAVLLCGITSLLGACATDMQATNMGLSESQCQKMNITQQGLMDGRAGKPNTEYSRFHDGCMAHNIKMSYARYFNGWIRGNRQFCSNQNVYHTGLTGEDYPAVCPNKPRLQATYQRGLHAKQRLVSMQAELNTINQQLSQLQGLQSQLKEIQENKERVKSDMEFFRDGYVHDNAQAELNDLVSKEQILSQQIKEITEKSNLKSNSPRKWIAQKKHLMASIKRLESQA